MSRLSQLFRRKAPVLTYDADGLRVTGKTVPFLKDDRFMTAYRAATTTGHQLSSVLHIEWRVAVNCWAASHAMKLDGDLVECGTCVGFTAVALCNYLNINATQKKFWLFDTFKGIPEDMASPQETHAKEMNGAIYQDDVYDLALKNLSPFPRARLVRGRVPETLTTADIGKVSYLHLDMNIAHPERAALEHFWPKLSPGAFVVLDDYAWPGHGAQMETADQFARLQGVEILTLPTGQGLIVKP